MTLAGARPNQDQSSQQGVSVSKLRHTATWAHGVTLQPACSNVPSCRHTSPVTIATYNIPDIKECLLGLNLKFHSLSYLHFITKRNTLLSVICRLGKMNICDDMILSSPSIPSTTFVTQKCQTFSFLPPLQCPGLEI